LLKDQLAREDDEEAAKEEEEDDEHEEDAARQQLELHEEAVETFSTWAEVELARLKAKYEGTFGYPPRGSRTDIVA
jgi:hypothetical protein